MHGGAILMDLSKAFDTLNLELLIAKLNPYDFLHNSLVSFKQSKELKLTFLSALSIILGYRVGFM